MESGKSYTLKATITPTNATDKKVKWTTSNKNVATVGLSGIVAAKAPGKATITVITHDGSKKATCVITVSAPQADKITLNKTTLTLKKGENYTLKPITTPDGAKYGVKWTSSNKDVVSVTRTFDGSGKIEALKKGKATITAKTTNGKTATCVVTVK